MVWDLAEVTAKGTTGTGSSACFGVDLASSGQSDLCGAGCHRTAAEPPAWAEAAEPVWVCRSSLVSAKGFVCSALARWVCAVSAPTSFLILSE